MSVWCSVFCQIRLEFEKAALWPCLFRWGQILILSLSLFFLLFLKLLPFKNGRRQPHKKYISVFLEVLWCLRFKNFFKRLFGSRIIAVCLGHSHPNLSWSFSLLCFSLFISTHTQTRRRRYPGNPGTLKLSLCFSVMFQLRLWHSCLN